MIRNLALGKLFSIRKRFAGSAGRTSEVIELEDTDEESAARMKERDIKRRRLRSKEAGSSDDESLEEIGVTRTRSFSAGSEEDSQDEAMRPSRSRRPNRNNSNGNMMPDSAQEVARSTLVQEKPAPLVAAQQTAEAIIDQIPRPAKVPVLSRKKLREEGPNANSASTKLGDNTLGDSLAAEMDNFFDNIDNGSSPFDFGVTDNLSDSAAASDGLLNFNLDFENAPAVSPVVDAAQFDFGEVEEEDSVLVPQEGDSECNNIPGLVNGDEAAFGSNINKKSNSLECQGIGSDSDNDCKSDQQQSNITSKAGTRKTDGAVVKKKQF